MANFLSSVGRAQPSRNVLDVINAKISLDQNQRRDQLTAAEMAMSAEQLAQMKRQGEYQEKLIKEGETPLAIETLASQFEGGPDGPMFKMVYDMADKAGYVDKTQGGMGTIKKRQMPEVAQMMSDPNFVMKLSRTRIDYWRGQLNQAQSVLAEKPQDKKALEAFQQATVGLNQAVGHDADLMKFQKEQEQIKVEEETAAQKRERDFEIWEKKQDIIVKNRPIKETPENKTLKERDRADKLRALPALEEAAQKEGPMAVYKDGWKMNDDGTVWTDRVTGAPERLPSFTEALGKRGGPTALRAAGEYYNDGMEIKDLLQDPQVASDLAKSENSTLWDRTKGTFENRVSEWLTKNGIAENTPTATVLRRMQMMASDARKQYLGAAITGTELKTITGWLLDPGDSYSAMMNKIELITKEGKQELKDFMDVYRNEANMAPWYEQYGIDRFKPEVKGVKDMSDAEINDALKNILR